MKKWERLAQLIEQEIWDHSDCLHPSHFGEGAGMFLDRCTLHRDIDQIIEAFKADQLSEGVSKGVETN